MKKLVIIAAVTALSVSCTVQKPLYNWNGYDNAVYNYTKSPNEKSLSELIEVYDKLMQPSKNQVPPPGLCADYGYLLIQKGETQRGKELLEMEVQLYPESKPFVERILKRFEK